MFVIISSVSLSLGFAEPAGLSPSNSKSCEAMTCKTGQFHPHCKCHLVSIWQGWGQEQFSSRFPVHHGGAADSLLPQIALFTMPYLLVHWVINDPYPCQSGWPNSLAKLKD